MHPSCEPQRLVCLSTVNSYLLRSPLRLLRYLGATRRRPCGDDSSPEWSRCANSSEFSRQHESFGVDHLGNIGAFSKLPSKRLLEMIAVNLCSPFPSDPCSVFINRRIESNVSFASPPLTLLVLQFNNCNLSQLDPIYSAKGRLWISRQRSPTLLPSRRNLFRTSSARGARTLPPARFRGPLCSGRKKGAPFQPSTTDKDWKSNFRVFLVVFSVIHTSFCLFWSGGSGVQKHV